MVSKSCVLYSAQTAREADLLYWLGFSEFNQRNEPRSEDPFYMNGWRDAFNVWAYDVEPEEYNYYSTGYLPRW